MLSLIIKELEANEVSTLKNLWCILKSKSLGMKTKGSLEVSASSHCKSGIPLSHKKGIYCRTKYKVTVCDVGSFN